MELVQPLILGFVLRSLLVVVVVVLFVGVGVAVMGIVAVVSSVSASLLSSAFMTTTLPPSVFVP